MTFSPDSQKLLLAENGALTLLDANSGEVLGAGMGNLPLPDKSFAPHPDWSPRGDSVVFTLAERGTARSIEKGSLALLSYDGSSFGPAEVIVASQGPDDNNFFPEFSPDGAYVAYVNARGPSENATSASIRLLR